MLTVKAYLGQFYPEQVKRQEFEVYTVIVDNLSKKLSSFFE